MKRILLFLICAMLLGGCSLFEPRSTMTFSGKTKHWHIEMVVTTIGNQQSEKVTYTYLGKRADLKNFHNLHYWYGLNANVVDGTLHADDGLSQKTYSSRSENNGLTITKTDKPMASIQLGSESPEESITLMLQKN